MGTLREKETDEKRAVQMARRADALDGGESTLGERLKTAGRAATVGVIFINIVIIGTGGRFGISFAYIKSEKNAFFLKKGALGGGLRLFKGRFVVYNVKAIVARPGRTGLRPSVRRGPARARVGRNVRKTTDAARH